MAFIHVGGVSTETGPTVVERKIQPSLCEGSVLLYTTHHDGGGVAEFTNSVPNLALPLMNSLEDQS